MSDAERHENNQAINAFYILEPTYIDASLNAAVSKYGSLNRYLKEGLGVKALQKDTLRDLLTIPQNGPAN